MKRLIFPVIAGIGLFCLLIPPVQGQDYSFRGGESLHRLSLVEPLGVGGVHVDMSAHFLNAEIDTSKEFDLHFNLSYGILPGFDFAYSTSYMRKINGEFNKYGLGDGIFTLKYISGGQENRVFKWGLQGSFLIPTGYSADISGFPPYTYNQYGVGGRYLAKIQGKNISLTGNIGGFWSEKGSISEMFYGFGVRMKLMGRLLMLAGEVTSIQSTSGKFADSFGYAGMESHLPYVGLVLHAGIEHQMKIDRPLRLIMGVSFTFRKTMPGVNRGILESKKRYKKVMIFDFVEKEKGFSDNNVRNQFCRNLGSLQEISLIEPEQKIAEKVCLSRADAVAAVPNEKADLLVFAQYNDFGYERNRGFAIPYLVSFPVTRAYISADLWVIDTKTSEQIYSGRLTGRASKMRGVTFFQPSLAGNMHYLDAAVKEKIRQKAVDDLIREMSVVFSDRLK